MKAQTKARLIERIKTLPGLEADDRAALLALLHESRPYGLVWEDKPEAVEQKLTEQLPVLVEDPSRRVMGQAATVQTGGGTDNQVVTENPNHILIEGDNLEALTALTYTHEGRIDVIYIDPPYNTGNKDFVYNDSFVDSDDNYRHSKWLSFMNKRLKIAKKVLSDKGIIFISIDENEIAPLRLLGDDIFGSNNFVGQYNWFKSATPPALSKKVKRTVEYILCWKGRCNDYRFKGAKKVSKSNDPFTKPRNSFKILKFRKGSITCAKTSGIITKGVYGTSKFPNELLDDLIISEGKNANDVRFKNRFIWLQETLDLNIKDGIHIELSKNGVLSYKRTNYAPEVPPNFIDKSVGVDTTENAGRALQELFENKVVFDYPKPVSLIKYLIDFMPIKDSIVLDFFAGSGTTMHAVMQLNAEDGGHRKCILVTNNENGICERVTWERNRRVIQGYTKPNGEHVEGLHGNNLRYYRTAYVPRTRTPQNLRRLMALATDMLCIKEDLYQEQPAFAGQRTFAHLFRYFEQGSKCMLVIYQEEYVPQLVQLIGKAQLPSGGRIKVYVFSPSDDPWAALFEPVQDRVELCALPMAIVNAYRRVLPRRHDPVIFNPDEEGGQA